MNPTLAETQRVFWDAISFPTGVSDYLAQADVNAVAIFNHSFSETPEFKRTARVDVYAEGYFFRLLGVLQEQFPMLVWLLGEAPFHNLVTDYLIAHPSKSPNLRRLGDALPGYLQSHPQTDHPPQLADMAQVELAIDHALDAADSTIYKSEQLATIPPQRWPGMRLSLCPSVQLVSSKWDFRVFRDAQRAGAPVPAVPASDPPLDICVWRKKFTVFTRTLSGGEGEMLRAIKGGATFADASEAAAQRGEDAQALVSHLIRWLEDELLCDCETAATQPAIGS